MTRLYCFLQLITWQKNKGWILEMTSPAPCALQRRSDGTALRRNASTRRTSYMPTWLNSYWLRRNGETGVGKIQRAYLSGNTLLSEDWRSLELVSCFFGGVFLQRTWRIQRETGWQSKWGRPCQDFIENRKFAICLGHFSLLFFQRTHINMMYPDWMCTNTSGNMQMWPI